MIGHTVWAARMGWIVAGIYLDAARTIVRRR